MLLPTLSCLLCLLSRGEGKAVQHPAQDYPGILFLRLMVLEEVDFRRQ